MKDRTLQRGLVGGEGHGGTQRAAGHGGAGSGHGTWLGWSPGCRVYAASSLLSGSLRKQGARLPPGAHQRLPGRSGKSLSPRPASERERGHTWFL